MDTKKTLLASGCSFTFEPWNWPTFVTQEMGWDLLNVGMASSGNGLISRKIIYNVNQLLKTHSSDDIVVGVMWSGFDRHEFHIDDPIHIQNINGWVENPTSIINGRKNWVITNIHWKNHHAKMWYEHLHTNVGAMIITLEHILRTQWFLEKHNIKYFMTSYLNIFNYMGANNIISDPEVKYLYDMIDFNKFLPIDGCHEWVKKYYEFSGGFNLPDKNGVVGIHPTEFGHKKFAEQVIVPYIKEKLL
jgi:hypothetical protein